MKKLLFPTDFSPAAENAFVYALAMASKINAKIIVLHAYRQDEDSEEDAALNSLDGVKQAAARLRKTAETHQLDHVELHFVLVEQDTIPAIVHTAKAEQADMVIMGTKGSTGLKEIFLGSVTSGVLGKIDTVLLAVPEGAKFKGEIGRIMYTVEYRDDEREGLLRVIEFAKLFHAEIHCIHFDLSFTDMLSGIMTRWKGDVSSAYSRIRFDTVISTDIAVSANDYCIEQQIDVAAMLPRRMNFFRKFFSTSVSKRLVNHLKIPLLVLPNVGA